MLDVMTLHRSLSSLKVTMNELARVQITTAGPLLCCSHQKGRQPGELFMIDESIRETVVAGMVH